MPHVKCPVCKKSGDWFNGKFGPFCSQRCKLIDLGKWFNGEHAISEPLRPEHFEKYVDLPPGENLDKPENED
ncbi:MAG TPA: DNA gyrase inhibitor YacG [Verrucomicrobiae bacterium]